jgi:hypothetical protein
VDQPDTGGNHRQREQHAHGDIAAQGFGHVGIRLAYGLQQGPEQAVAQQEETGIETRLFQRAEFPGRDIDDGKQGQAFQGCFIKLAGMTRRAQGVGGKAHAPGQFGRPAPQLAIDEVGQPAEEQTDRRYYRGRIGDAHQVQLFPAGKDEERQRDTDQPAMEGHAAIGDAEDDVLRALPDHVGHVEDDIAQPSTDDDAQRGPDQKIVYLRLREGRLGLLRAGRMPDLRPPGEGDHVAPAEQQAGDIGQRVPAQIEAQFHAEQVERADREQDGVDQVEAGRTEFHE